MIKRLRRRLTIILTAITGSILIAVLSISLWYAVEQMKLSSMERLTSDAGYLSISLDLTSEDNAHNVEVLEALGQEKDYILSLKVNGESQLDEGALSPEEVEIIAVAEGAVLDSSVSYTTTATAATLPSLFSSIGIVELRDAYWVDTTIYRTEETFEHGEETEYAGSVYDETIQVTDESEGISILFNVSSDGYWYPDFTYSGTDYRVNAIEMSDMQNGSPVSYQLMIIQELTGESRQIFLLYLGYISLMLFGCLLLFVGNWFLTKLVVRPTEEGLRRQTEFVAAASHELRSPLTTLRASLMAANISDTEEQAEKFRGCALQEADRMGRLINDLLILAGSDSKKWNIDKKPFDMDTLLIETHEQYEPVAKQKNRRLQLALPDRALPECTGDRHRIRQILSVLLDNALEYSPEGSTVRLTAKQKNKKLLLSVTDEGTGIPEGEKKRIFDRFYRTDKSRTDKAHFGLGLSVAKELAQLHGGTISVHDEPGGGTRFTLQLNI